MWDPYPDEMSEMDPDPNITIRIKPTIWRPTQYFSNEAGADLPPSLDPLREGCKHFGSHPKLDQREEQNTFLNIVYPFLELINAQMKNKWFSYHDNRP